MDKAIIILLVTFRCRQEKALQLKGIGLLECVLQKVGKNRLPVELMMEFDSVLYMPMVCECQ